MTPQVAGASPHRLGETAGQTDSVRLSCEWKPEGGTHRRRKSQGVGEARPCARRPRGLGGGLGGGASGQPEQALLRPMYLLTDPVLCGVP